MRSVSSLVEQLQQTSSISLNLLEIIENLDISLDEWKFLANSLSVSSKQDQYWWQLRLFLDLQADQAELLFLRLDDPTLITHLESDPSIRLFVAQGYLALWQCQMAKTWLKTITPSEKPRHAFWYWSSLALVNAQINEPFDQAFQNAREYCSGHDLGILWLNQGWALSKIGQNDKALECWQTALEHLRFPSMAMALADYNVGQILLERLDPAAEHYFLKMQKVTRYAVVATQRSAAFLGLGDWHRLHGRLTQARALYTRGLKATVTFEVLGSQIDAYAKLALVAILENKLREAKLNLEAAKKLISEAGTYDWVNTIEAFLYIKLGDLEMARLVLDGTQNLLTNGLNRAGVLRAELERRLGNETKALAILQTLDAANIGSRELVLQFPELFVLADQHGVQIKAILEKQRYFKVQALGVLNVICDERKLVLPKGCDELLIYFLYYGTRDRDEALESLFWEEIKILNTMTLNTARKHFNKLLQRLREVLQWHDVIQLKGTTYAVNLEGAIWELDWKSVTKKRLRSEFLIASKRQWVKDIRSNL